jgi:hypothetical protein
VWFLGFGSDFILYSIIIFSISYNSLRSTSVENEACMLCCFYYFIYNKKKNSSAFSALLRSVLFCAFLFCSATPTPVRMPERVYGIPLSVYGIYYILYFIRRYTLCVLLLLCIGYI